MIWTDEALGKLSHEHLHNVWTNASKLGDEELVRRIEASGLPYLDPKGMTLDSAAGRALYKVIFSQAGREAGAAATEVGFPALAFIEPLIVAAMGPAYAAQYESTVQAGYLVSKMMETSGFNKTGSKRPMPAGSIAKTAEFFRRKS